MLFGNFLYKLKVPLIWFNNNTFVDANECFNNWENFFYDKNIRKDNLSINDFFLTYFGDDVLSDYLQLYYKLKEFVISANDNLTKIEVYIEGDKAIIAVCDNRRLSNTLSSFAYNIADRFFEKNILVWDSVVDFLAKKSRASAVYLYLKKDDLFELVASSVSVNKPDEKKFLETDLIIDITDIYYENDSIDIAILKNKIDKGYKTLLFSIGRSGKLLGVCILNFKKNINYYIIDGFSQLFNILYVILYNDFLDKK